MNHFRHLPPRLQFKILDWIENPRMISVICKACPHLTENNHYWQERYADFFREMTDRLPLNHPSAMYQAFILRGLIVEDVSDRRIKLIRALRKVGLYIRNDSRLCAHWINGVEGVKPPKWTLELVVKKCIEMRWLFEYCDFSLKLRDYLKEQNVEYSDEHFNRAVQLVLAKKPVPDELPWLMSESVEGYHYVYDSDDPDNSGYESDQSDYILG